MITPYEIIIICSVGGILVGCLVIWGCERICSINMNTKKGGEPLLNLSEPNKNASFSSDSSGSDSTSIFMTNIY